MAVLKICPQKLGGGGGASCHKSDDGTQIFAIKNWRIFKPGSPDPLPNKNKKGESLEDFDRVLDMVGHGWAWFGIVRPHLKILSAKKLSTY